MTTAHANPPMDPAQDVAKDGGTQQVGDYLVGYAIEDAEGMYNLEDGGYTLRVHVDPPTFMRHDEINGRRFTEPVDVEFAGVRIERGAEPVDPPETDG
ncbi:hypothetical protein ACFO6V_03910 [Promicromonospora alba]|uniref:Uncharacterized protein n=1 Tax=Promicromonospora alba TaxID=1616110 RepID=A0ABV9HEY9_9MICO